MSRRLVIAVLCLALGCAPKADLVIVHGMVWTGLSTGRPQPGVVAISGDSILAVGDSASVARYVSASTKVLDARGGLVMPGFDDAHTHFVDGGFQLASLDLRNAGTPQEFVRRVKGFARGRKPGEWIVGGVCAHTLWKGQPLPHHEWIDSVTPDNPGFINRLDGPEALANGAAMRAAKATTATPTPSRGQMPPDAVG